MKKKVFVNIILALVFVLGLALIFNNQIKEFVVQHMVQSSVQQEIGKATKKADYNLKNVEALDAKTALDAALNGTDAPIGKIAIPKLKIKLAIYEGVANVNLARGVGTMKPNQVMGQKNYALAGHHMSDPQALFSPLVDAQIGQKIYLTNGKTLYTYQIQQKVDVKATEVQWIDDQPDEKLLTLVTCSTAQPGVKTRLIIRANLVDQAKLTKKTAKYFV